jgi:hypothetical protein
MASKATTDMMLTNKKNKKKVRIEVWSPTVDEQAPNWAIADDTMEHVLMQLINS